MKKPTVRIAIPAYNEAESIGDLLKSIFGQQMSSFVLQDVVVYTDGSTDETPEIVKGFQKQFPKLSLKHAKENKGKLFRLNQMFTENTADVLIILDADIALVGNDFLINLIEPMIANDTAMLVAAHSTLVLPKNFTGKLVASAFLTWDYIRLTIPGMDSVHNFSSQATAYRGNFAKKLHIPSSALEERIYLYLMAKKENPQGFVYALNAEVKFLPPASFQDLILMTHRPFGKKQEDIDTIFGFDTETLQIVPRKYKIKGLLLSFLHHPLLTPVGLVFNFIIPRIAARRTTNNSGQWERSASTKGRITT